MESAPRRRTPIDRHSLSALGRAPDAEAVAPRPARAATGNGCSRAGRTITPPGIYVVAAGDTLWDIADRHYRNGARYALLRRVNAGRIADADLIWPCQRLRLPRLVR